MYGQRLIKTEIERLDQKLQEVDRSIATSQFKPNDDIFHQRSKILSQLFELETMRMKGKRELPAQYKAE